MMASEKTKCFLSQKDLDIIIHVFKIFQVELRSGLIASEVDDKNIFLLITKRNMFIFRIL